MSADVSCRRCGQGWWVTAPDRLAWTGCPDCPPEPTPIFTPDAMRTGPLWVLLVGLLIAAALVVVVVGVIAR